jgi:hypothetical protein
MLEVFVVMKNNEPECAFASEVGAEAYCETRRRADEAEWLRGNPDADRASYSAVNAWAHRRLELKAI